MKFTPQSMALCSAASDSESSTGPHALPMAHAPKLISETFQGVRPSDRYFMDSLLMMLSDFHRGDAETQRKIEEPESHSSLVPLSVFSASQRLRGEAFLFRIFSRHLQGHGGHRMMLSDFHRGDAETQRKIEEPESHSSLVPLSVFSASQRLCGEALLFRVFSRHLQGHGGPRQRRQRDFDAA